MHELSLCIELIEQLEEIAKQNKLKKIDEVHIETGELKEVIPLIMKDAFRSAGMGTKCEKAKLVIKKINAAAECRICRKRFRPNIDSFLCPFCNETDIKILEGQDIIIKKVISENK